MEMAKKKGSNPSILTLKNGPWNTKKHSGSSFSNAQSRELAQLREIVLKQEMVIRDCKQSVFSKKQVLSKCEEELKELESKLSRELNMLTLSRTNNSQSLRSRYEFESKEMMRLKDAVERKTQELQRLSSYERQIEKPSSTQHLEIENQIQQLNETAEKWKNEFYKTTKEMEQFEKEERERFDSQYQSLQTKVSIEDELHRQCESKRKEIEDLKRLLEKKGFSEHVSSLYKHISRLNEAIDTTWKQKELKKRLQAKVSPSDVEKAKKTIEEIEKQQQSERTNEKREQAKELKRVIKDLKSQVSEKNKEMEEQYEILEKLGSMEEQASKQFNETISEETMLGAILGEFSKKH
eukprot:TRINITY_DN10665_c0_g1_i1.p2 TRINITY_DN10665_c0_g1~~TRINITY_DN10665_c0_g1_i1.p2  ORF type:complete len:351 (-),score=132.12 TRINITY_DN10665_c0_g1_i1:5-1057(-)